MRVFRFLVVQPQEHFENLSACMKELGAVSSKALSVRSICSVLIRS